tara:strand:+ start:3867 stop:4103 length:237 start_codon:yes stop_codon:yes gene_type:complete
MKFVRGMNPSLYFSDCGSWKIKRANRAKRNEGSSYSTPKATYDLFRVNSDKELLLGNFITIQEAKDKANNLEEYAKEC